MSFSPTRGLWEKFKNSLCYTKHDHLSNAGERTCNTPGTQNTGAKTFFCFKVFPATLPSELMQPLLSLALYLTQHKILFHSLINKYRNVFCCSQMLRPSKLANEC